MLLNQFPIKYANDTLLLVSPLGWRNHQLGRYSHIGNIRIEGTVALPTHEIALSQLLLLFTDLTNHIISIDPRNNQKISHSITFLADKVGRGSLLIEGEYFWAGGSGDGDGVSSKEDLFFSEGGE